MNSCLWLYGFKTRIIVYLYLPSLLFSFMVKSFTFMYREVSAVRVLGTESFQNMENPYYIAYNKLVSTDIDVNIRNMINGGSH